MQFGRLLTLTVGNKNEAVKIVYDERIRQVPNIAANLKKGIKAEPNTATINIDNLSENIRNRISLKEFNLVRLEVARYGEELRTIFVGTIDKSEHRRESSTATTTTTLECGDGSIQYASSYSSKTLKKGMSDRDTILELIKDMEGIELGIQELPKDRKLPRGKTLLGNSRDEMNAIAKRNNADWSYQDGKLIVIPKDKVLPDSYGYLISQSTGMVDSPQKNSDGGLSVKMFLNPSIFIGSLIRVRSIINDYNGDYKVTELEATISTRGQEWHQTCSVVGGKFQIIEDAKK